MIAEQVGYESLGNSMVADRLGAVAEDGNQAAAAAVRELEVEQLDPMHMLVVRLVLSPAMRPLDEAASLPVEAEPDTPGTVADRMPVAEDAPSLAVWPLWDTAGH